MTKQSSNNKQDRVLRNENVQSSLGTLPFALDRLMMSPALAHSTSTTHKSFTRHVTVEYFHYIRNYNVCQNNLDAFLVLKGLHIMGSTVQHH